MAKRTKQPNGAGSVYQRKDGRWEGAAFLEALDGTRTRFRVYGKTWEEANAKLTEALANARKGIPVETTKLGFGDYLTYWLEQIARPKVRPSTYRSYETYVRLYLIPGLGKKQLKKLTAQDIRTWLVKVAKTCQCCLQGHDAKRPKQHKDPTKQQRCCAVEKCCRKVPSPRTVQYLHALVRSALAQAVREDLVLRNVAKNVQLGTVERPEIQALTLDEARQFLRQARKGRFYAVYAVALGVGLRRGEALGLRWDDVDLNNGVLRVRQALQRQKGEGLKLVPLKTQRSRRTIRLPDNLVKVLKERKAEQAAERLAAGSAWHDPHGLVFTTHIGTAIEPENLYRHFRAVCDAAGIRRVRLHDLRHTCATILLAQGVDTRTIMEILGHSTIVLTMNTYAHVMPEHQAKALNRLEEALGGLA
ncbi:site-specific integrase [Planotetraspora silvatica]|uniref:Site-specific integrase n=1 Tax=Planotetraspora silvatica TaxID=234614 RepID=A0A8J3UV78_9ACTN|nr:site-specific integrase [Planotetraspora silvatica]GII51371.1 site-specific integrase [Planotetraspora silvatica]